MDANDKYIHPFSDEIRGFVKRFAADSAEGFIKELLAWFDENVTYSRINAPFYPLQRSDLELLSMKCGTCGDFSNLIVSCLLSVGIPAKYAIIKKDVYGDPQDHICAAALVRGRRILIDATLPYRKWFGYDCRHQEFELNEPDEFEKRLREIEDECISAAKERAIPEYAGLLYAPWIHDEILVRTEARLDSAFYLMIMRGFGNWTLYATYMAYTAERGRTPVMAEISPSGTRFRFSVREPSDIWDPDQWGESFTAETVPDELISPEFKKLRENTEKNVPRILRAARIEKAQ